MARSPVAPQGGTADAVQHAASRCERPGASTFGVASEDRQEARGWHEDGRAAGLPRGGSNRQSSFSSHAAGTTAAVRDRCHVHRATHVGAPIAGLPRPWRPSVRMCRRYVASRAVGQPADACGWCAPRGHAATDRAMGLNPRGGASAGRARSPTRGFRHRAGSWGEDRMMEPDCRRGTRGGCREAALRHVVQPALSRPCRCHRWEVIGHRVREA